MKYIIKNCPCYCEGTVVKGNQKITKACESIQRTIKEGEYRLEKCCNIDACLIKRIVKLCNDALAQETDPLNSSEMSFARKILDLLRIEEVNE